MRYTPGGGRQTNPMLSPVSYSMRMAPEISTCDEVRCHYRLRKEGLYVQRGDRFWGQVREFSGSSRAP
jgi:hypothetical protein